MSIVEFNGKQYRVHNNGLVHVFQRNKNNNYAWVVISSNKNRRAEYYSVLSLAKLQ
jgi:hypothetical protein